MEMARDVVIAPEPDNDTGDPGPNSHDDQPLIIAESNREIPTVSVGDAVMLMDLADTNVFVFRNVKNNALEVVHKRTDGNVGWISPES